MRVAAEGMETVAQKDVLLKMKCDEFQGFYFSAPLSAGAVAEMLDQRSSRPEPPYVAESLAALSRVHAEEEAVPVGR
jgi:predicted signal transduction protein with EAL and GGDEF domain